MYIGRQWHLADPVDTLLGRQGHHLDALLTVLQHLNLQAVIHHDPDSLAELRPDLPAAFLHVIEKALQKDAGSRYQRMSELAGALRAVAAGDEPADPEREAAPVGRAWWIYAVAAALVAAAVWAIAAWL